MNLRDTVPGDRRSEAFSLKTIIIAMHFSIFISDHRICLKRPSQNT